MSWAAITSDEIKTRLSGPEASALQTSALAVGQVDPLPDVISQVTDEVRGYIAANGANTLGLAGTLPPQVRSAAIAIIRWRLAGRLAIGKAAELLQSESRRQEYEDAINFLKDVAAGKVAIEVPANPATETTPQLAGEWGSNEQVDFTAL